MQINLSEETINVVCNSLRDSKLSLKNQLRNCKEEGNKLEILKNQLAGVTEALNVFEELQNSF